MSAREDLSNVVSFAEIRIVESAAWVEELYQAVKEEVLREAAEKIREDRDRQEAPGQYSVGMSRAAFLIDPDNEKP